MTSARALTCAVVALGLSGCGTAVPKIQEAWDHDIPADKDRPVITGTAQIEFEIKKRIFCDLKDAVQAVRAIPYYEGDDPGHLKQVPNGLLPSDWGAQLTLSLEADESSALNPGIGLINPMANSQSYTTGFGGTLSSTASRIDKFDSYYTVDYLKENSRSYEICYGDRIKNDPIAQFNPPSSSPFILESDLGIKDWLVGSLIYNKAIPSVGSPPSNSISAKPSGGAKSGGSGSGGGGGGAQPDTITLDEKFVIVSNGNVNPTWKLTHISANTGNTPLFGVGRTRTHELILTLGPPKAASADTHLASQINSGRLSSAPVP